MNYIKSWFFIDFISVLPLDLIIEYGNVNKIIRFSRIGKIYKILKVTKMLRLSQVVKLKHKMSYVMSKIQKYGEGIETMIYMLISTVILQHVTACLW